MNKIFKNLNTESYISIDNDLNNIEILKYSKLQIKILIYIIFWKQGI